MRWIMRDDECKLTMHDRPMQTRRRLTHVHSTKSKSALVARKASLGWLSKINVSMKSQVRWMWDLYIMLLLFYTAIAVVSRHIFLSY